MPWSGYPQADEAQATRSRDRTPMLTSRSQRLWVVVEVIAWLVTIALLLVWLVRYVDRFMGARPAEQELARLQPPGLQPSGEQPSGEQPLTPYSAAAETILYCASWTTTNCAASQVNGMWARRSSLR